MLLTFDFSSDTPLYIQLRNQIIIGIADGRLISGEKLPTVRALAEESGINTMTVSKAYQLLKQEGYITTDRRSGAAVAPRGERGSVSEETLSALRLSLSGSCALRDLAARRLWSCAISFTAIRTRRRQNDLANHSLGQSHMAAVLDVQSARR